MLRAVDQEEHQEIFLAQREELGPADIYRADPIPQWPDVEGDREVRRRDRPLDLNKQAIGTNERRLVRVRQHRRDMATVVASGREAVRSQYVRGCIDVFG